MGAKGPLFVVVLGAGALIAFGMMAKLLVQEVPTAQAVVQYRQFLADQYAPQRVEIHATGGEFRVRLHGGTLESTPDGAAVGVLARDFRQQYRPSRALASVEFIGMTVGGGCTAPEQRWRAIFDYEAESDKVAAEVSGRLGMPCRLRVLSATALRLEVRKLLNPAQRKSVGRELGQLWGGGWQYIQIRTGGRVYNFDADGKPLR